MKKKPKLTEKQKRFVKHYLTNLNATKAAISAGYAQKGAHVTGCRLLKNPKVKDAVERGNDKIAEKLDITSGYVLGKAKDILERCSQENEFQPAPALKALELLGKHLRLFGDNAVLVPGATFSIGQVPFEALEEEKAKAANPPATPIGQPKPEEKIVIRVPNKLVN